MNIKRVSTLLIAAVFSRLFSAALARTSTGDIHLKRRRTGFWTVVRLLAVVVLLSVGSLASPIHPPPGYDQSAILNSPSAMPAPHVSLSISPLPKPTQRPQPQLQVAYGKLPLSFEANYGQTDPQVKFLTRGRGSTLFLTETEAVMVLPQPQQDALFPRWRTRGGGDVI